MGPNGAGGTTGEPPDPRKLAQDWITLWQSELSAMAADPEMRKSWQTVMAFRAGTMSAMLRGLPRAAPSERPGKPAADPHDRTRRQARTADAPRPRPLMLHLTLAMLRSSASRATSPLWNADWPTSSVAAILQSIQSAVRDGNHEREFPAAVIAEELYAKMRH